MKVEGIGNCHCMALRRAARRISQMYDEALAPAGLGAAQFAMMATLSADDGMNINDLAERLDLDRTTTGKNLRPLERDGLIAVRVSAEDRRSRVVALTAKGRSKLSTAFPLWSIAQQSFEAANGRRRTRAMRLELGNLAIESNQRQLA